MDGSSNRADVGAKDSLPWRDPAGRAMDAGARTVFSMVTDAVNPS